MYNRHVQLISYLGKSFRHLKCPDSVHVRGHDGDPIVGLLGVPEGDLPVQVHVRPALQGASLRP